MAIVKSGDFTFAFPTLILERQVPNAEELNAQLMPAILEEKKQDSGIQRSNVQGWHSSLEWFARETDALKPFQQILRKTAGEYWAMEQQRDLKGEKLAMQIAGWAMVYPRGAYAVPHCHPNSNFSGVYYVDAGDYERAKGEKSGVLSLMDPRVSASAHLTDGFARATSMEIPAKTGKLVLFPAWLMHHVHPYEGERPRVAISFNVTVHAGRSVSSVAQDAGS